MELARRPFILSATRYAKLLSIVAMFSLLSPEAQHAQLLKLQRAVATYMVERGENVSGNGEIEDEYAHHFMFMDPFGLATGTDPDDGADLTTDGVYCRVLGSPSPAHRSRSQQNAMSMPVHVPTVPLVTQNRRATARILPGPLGGAGASGGDSKPHK